MKLPDSEGRRRARIEIIPLIDVIFFLLATFMILSLSMVKNQGIAVHLPVATMAQKMDLNDYISISVTANGAYSWDKDTITREQLPERLRVLKTANPDPKIYINGDTKVDFGSIVAVLDEVKKAGISKVAIQTEPR
jgi:biopolymer transport protein ExbD